jgi:hypothetical protein
LYCSCPHTGFGRKRNGSARRTFLVAQNMMENTVFYGVNINNYLFTDSGILQCTISVMEIFSTIVHLKPIESIPAKREKPVEELRTTIFQEIETFYLKVYKLFFPNRE